MSATSTKRWCSTSCAAGSARGLRGHDHRQHHRYRRQDPHQVRRAGRPWWAHAYANERALHVAYDVLGCPPPTYEPRATGHIPEMVELIETLIDKGNAYVAPDGSGDVYFDVRSWPSYG